MRSRGGEERMGEKKGMRECELCERTARMYCESDDARLCWECDARVHGANFLVARHTRCLLCRSCHEPTPWKAAGPRLGPTVSVCHRCATSGSGEQKPLEKEEEEEEEDGDDGGGGRGEDESSDEEDDEGEEEEEDGDNQVVPWSTTTPPPPPEPSSASSGQEEGEGEEEEEEETSGICNGLLKRRREENVHVDPAHQNDDGDSNSQTSIIPWADSSGHAGSSFADSFRPFKDRKRADRHGHRPASDASAIRNLRDHRAVHLASLTPPI